MKKILISGCAMLAMLAGKAQQKEGKVVYQRTVQMQVSFAGMNEEMQRMIPRTRTEKFDLVFGNNQSVWKLGEQDADNENVFGSEGGGIQVRTFTGGSDDVVYTNFETAKRVERRELFEKTFIIDDSVRGLKWKMTGESKSILNHNCMKAVATQISQRMQMTMNDGKMERKEVADTATVIAWFASDIPVSAGPAEYQGQLPGLILELDVNNGRQTFKAVEIKDKADLALIKEPTGKKHYTTEEFNKERRKMMDQMQQNNTGGNRRIIMN